MLPNLHLGIGDNLYMPIFGQKKEVIQESPPYLCKHNNKSKNSKIQEKKISCPIIESKTLKTIRLFKANGISKKFVRTRLVVKSLFFMVSHLTYADSAHF